MSQRMCYTCELLICIHYFIITSIVIITHLHFIRLLDKAIKKDNLNLFIDDITMYLALCKM